jgi:tripartite-type tricarboxylate transporter receptor subunit TctC
MGRWSIIACVICCFCAAPGAHAGSYPDRPLHLIVPFAAGGTFDLVARVTAEKLSEVCGQNVVVDNRPGGATFIAVGLAARARPDGYTLYLSPNSLAANPALYKEMPVDAQRALTPVILLASQPMALGANLSFDAHSINDVVKIAKAKPGKLMYGAAGVGSGGWLAGELFKSAADVNIGSVPYKGGNVAMMDVMANRIPLVMTGLPNLLPFMKDRRLNILGTTEATRSPIAPEIPTIGETVPGYEFRNWFGILVPTGTPRHIIARLNADYNKVLESADVKQRLTDAGFVLIGGTPNEFASVIAKDTQKFERVIAQSGITIH